MIDLLIPSGAKTLTLPPNDHIRVMAATLVSTPFGETTPAQPLYDQTRNSLVQITTDSTSFAGQSTFTLSSPIPSSNIYYTLDGTEPIVTSALYKEPITVNNTTTLNARAVKAGYNNEYVVSKTVTKIGLRDAISVSDLVNGLKGAYYEIELERLPNFDTVPSVSEYITDTIAIPENARDEDYALTFTGYVHVPADGVYAFSINSDDGSRLYVSDTLLADNDGLHGDYEMTGVIGLKAGYHKFTAQMFQCKGDDALGVSVAGPSLPKQAIPSAMFWHKK